MKERAAPAAPHTASVLADPVLIFDFPAQQTATARGARTQRLTFDNPVEVLQTHAVADVRALLREAEAATTRGWYAAGFVSYEAAPAFDAAHDVRTGGTLPLAWFGIYRAPTESSAGSIDGVSALDERGGTDDTRHTLDELEPQVDRASYDEAVRRIREAIAQGDVYQVNYTFPLRGALDARDLGPAAARALYERLAREGHGGYGAYLDIGTHRLLSFSPELFFERAGDHAICRPMKGTIARGRWAEEDAARARWLEASEKNRAENVMIVDLVRNDLGRVARVGGVRVSSLCAIERYPTVWQMTSTVEADLRAGTTLEGMFEALFPCGSITGAPKIAAMQQIAALESSPRGVYCGAIGFAAPERSVFNVAIRTLTIDAARHAAEYPVGGGVTWDSRSREEYAEAHAKAALLQPRPAFSLLETMRVDSGVIVREERHLARLLASARYFDIVQSDDDAADLRRRVQDHLHARVAARVDGSWRLRLLVDKAGACETTIVRCDAVDDSAAPRAVDPRVMAPCSVSPRAVALARTPVDPEDPFLCHKTTRRAIYDERRAEWPDAFDVLLWNTRGELTEFTIGNLVLALDGQHVTPSRSCGLLAGTFREALIDEAVLVERVLTLDDLRRAEGAWLINAVREWVSVTFDTTSLVTPTPTE